MSRPAAGSRAAELRKQLLRIARADREDFQVTLSRYGVERLLYRLSTSRHGDVFILKGAMLVATWMGVPYRSTRDLDLLGSGDPAPERLAAVFREVVLLDGGDDAFVLDPDSVRAEEIRGEDRYGGVRVRITGDFGGALIPLQIDVGFGDAVEPAAEWIEYPTLLGLPAPRIRGYGRCNVVAEKLEAMISLGMLNSRMKDYFDIWILSRAFPFRGAELTGAIRATFERRGTVLPATLPEVFGRGFSADPEKRRLWAAFVDRAHLVDRPDGLDEVVDAISDFAWPVLMAAAAGSGLEAEWSAGGPWI